MRRWAAGCLAALLLLVPFSWSVGRAAVSLPDPGEHYIKVRTAHFTLFSNASESRTLEIGTSLERFRAALARVVSGLEVNSPVPTLIYVFKNDESFRPYKRRVGLGPANVSGEFAAHRDGNYVGIDASPPTDPWGVVYHEYLHYFLDNNFTDIPLWFNEGIAECYSTFTADAGHVEIGRPIDDHVRRLRADTWIPLPDLFAIDEDSQDYNEGDRQGMFYAESWALAHYLAWGRTDAQARGVEFLAQFPARSGLRDALKPLVGPDWGVLETRVSEYVRRAKFTYSILDIGEVKFEARADSAPMTYAEALTRLGDYLLRSQNGREAEAEAHFQAAIAADPALAPAYAGLGYVRDRQQRRQDAAVFYEKALHLAPDDPLTLFLYAQSLMDRLSPPGAVTRREAGALASPDLARARDLYVKSIRLRPDVAEAYAGLGETFTLDDADPSAGIKALEKARRMLPSRLDVVLNLAQLYARSGERSKTRDLVEGVVQRSGDKRSIEIGREILLGADIKAAETLIDKGDIDAGVALLKEVRGKTLDTVLQRRLDDHLAQIEQVRTLNRQIEAYNRAADLANRKAYRKSAAILEALVQEVQDPKLAREAGTLLTRVRQAMAAAAKR